MSTCEGCKWFRDADGSIASLDDDGCTCMQCLEAACDGDESRPGYQAAEKEDQ